MSRSWQLRWWFVVIAAWSGLVFTSVAQDADNSSVSSRDEQSATNASSARLYGGSPVGLFRKLLLMTPDERDSSLSNRTAEARARILAKVAEYEAMNPNDRELRLRATELRWYLMPLLHDSAANRTALLAQVPPDLQQLIQDRLTEWNILPPTLRDEFIENEHILDYFAQVNSRNGASEADGHKPTAAERAHWDDLSDAERRQIAAGFNHFFELTPDEKQSALNTLSEAERNQMEKTLQAFAKLPPAQRDECVGAFARFASMTTPDKAEFLKNADRWAAMTPSERQAWRDLVINVPNWPPLPIGWTLPVQGGYPAGAATNHN